MTDTVQETDIPLDAHLDAVQRRALHRKRYASESRFKFLGLGSIALSVCFLIVLLYTVVGNGLPAFTYHYLTLPIDLSEIEDIEKGNYTSPVKKGVAEAIPYLTTRKEKRLARGLISSGAAIELRREVIENPTLAGEKAQIGVPVSDFADLYLKGLTAKSIYSTPESTLRISANEGTVDIEANVDVFANFLATVKNVISRDADRSRLRIAGLQASLDNQREIAAVSENPDQIARAKEAIAALETQVDTLTARYDALIARRDNASSREVLDSSMPSLLVKFAGGAIKLTEVEANSAKGEVVIEPKSLEAASGKWTMQQIVEAEENRKFTDREVVVMDRLVSEGLVENRWNSIFFSKGASREPELAGIWGAVVGSFFTMLITLLLSFPLGVAAAIYLEEFAPKNKFTNLIEVNINNLAAVPSIVFGLLGLAVFLNFFGLPRSAPLVGGIVLALMTLPTIIIASRAALKAVPPSIREAALGVGASKLQAVIHHVLPLAMPGILTGTIIGMAQALGETAPLLMIGMVAFVVDVPAGITDPATVLPVQIYMWADFPEPGFQQKTAAAIMVLLGFLVLMNAIAVLLRKRFERRW